MDKQLVFKTRHFARWMRKTELPNQALCEAVCEMLLGLVDADLGGHVFKKRVALPSRGKRGAIRTLVATHQRGTWFFVFGFEKNDRANISTKELEALQAIAQDLLSLSPKELDANITFGALEKICHDDDA